MIHSLSLWTWQASLSLSGSSSPLCFLQFFSPFLTLSSCPFQDDKLMSACISISLFCRRHHISPRLITYTPTHTHAQGHTHTHTVDYWHVRASWSATIVQSVYKPGLSCDPFCLCTCVCVCIVKDGPIADLCVICVCVCERVFLRDFGVRLVIDFPICAEHGSVTELDTAQVGFLLASTTNAGL